MNAKKEVGFKVGQTVWCVLLGEGKIADIDNDCVHPVCVEFDNGKEACYTLGGKYSKEFNRTLFFSEPKIEAQEFPPKYVGRLVFLVSIEDGDTDGPFEITKEDSGYVYAREVCFYKKDYRIYIVEPEEVVE